MIVNDGQRGGEESGSGAADGWVFVGVCRLCVSPGVVLLGERGNLYFCNKVITDAPPQGAPPPCWVSALSFPVGGCQLKLSFLILVHI